MTKSALCGVVAVLAGACILSVFARTSNLNLRPGMYVVTVTYEVQDQRESEPRTATRCISNRDLNEPESIFAAQTSGSADSERTCSVRNLKTANDRVSYDADCSNRSVHVNGNVNGDEFSVVRMVRPKGNQLVSLRFTVHGKRTGDCPISPGD